VVLGLPGWRLRPVAAPPLVAPQTARINHWRHEMIIDYSVARPPVATLKAAGVTAVGRYIGWDSVPGFHSIGKNLTRTEAGHLLAAGIGIFLAFEYAPDAALRGHVQGLRDGELATRQLHDLGAPPGMAVYFAVDFDIRDYAPHSADPAARLGPAADYFAAIRSLHPAYQVGIYGGYWAVSRALDARLASIAWQTIAWSGGQWDPRAVIRQKLGTPIPGADFDEVREHTVHGPDFGQWPRPHQPPEPKGPLVRRTETHVTEGHLSLHALADRHKTTPMHILRLTSDQPGGFPPEVYEWGNDVFAGVIDAQADVPAGLRLRVPVIP
jgi:hypothetical protein